MSMQGSPGWPSEPRTIQTGKGPLVSPFLIGALIRRRKGGRSTGVRLVAHEHEKVRPSTGKVGETLTWPRGRYKNYRILNRGPADGRGDTDGVGLADGTG